MANPPKQKGTAAETELVKLLNDYFGPGTFRRNETNGRYDIFKPTAEASVFEPINVLATRPDRGRWLVTIDLATFMDLLVNKPWPIHIEVKRYARFALHTIFEQKFGVRS